MTQFFWSGEFDKRKNRKLRTQDVHSLSCRIQLLDSHPLDNIIYLLRFAHWILLNVSLFRLFSHIIHVHSGSNHYLLYFVFVTVSFTYI